MNTNDESKETPANEVNAQQQHPQRGTHQPTIKESTELLKKLADFNSRKEDVLKRIAAIGEKMQKRIDGLSTSNGSSQEELKEEKEPQTKVGTDHPEHSIHMPSYANPSSAIQPIQRVTYTRIRETPKPVFVEGCFNVAFPNKQAFTEEWKAMTLKMGEHSFQSEFDFCDDHVELKPGNKMTIPLGVKVCVPDGFAMLVESIPGLVIVTPKILTKFSNRDELKITVMNQTSEPLNLMYGVNLFTFHFIKLYQEIHLDELLNSTYDDWVNGTITG